MDKRGMVNWQLWIFNVATVVIFASVIMLVVNSTINNQLETSNLQVKIIGQRLLYSPECFAAADETSQKILVGTVEQSRISNETIRQCLNVDKLAVRVTYGTGPDKKTYYHDETTFKDLDPISFSQQYMTYEDSFFVRVRKNQKYVGFQIMNIKVIMRR